MRKRRLYLVPTTALLLFPVGYRVPVFLSGAPDLSPSMGSPDRPDMTARCGGWLSFPSVFNNSEGE